MSKKIGFALEYALGHITHAENLKATLPEGIDPRYVEIPYSVLPSLKNWSLRASLTAWRGLKSAGKLDGLFYHTQITTLFAAPMLRRTPGIVSLDATPAQMDILGAAYGHKPGSPRAEAIKKKLLIRTLGAARHIVTWSQWTKDSLMTDYGQPAGKITVIPPGVPMVSPSPNNGEPNKEFSASGPPLSGLGEQPRALFVGGDFGRKGGEELLDAWKALRPDAHLDIVTQSDVNTSLPGVTVHRGIRPNSPELRALFAQASVFVFPTRADCLPLAVLEAAAAGLPVISTAVGAIPEAVLDGQTGRIVPVQSSDALASALDALFKNPDERQRLGENARTLARDRFDRAKNYPKLVELIPTTCR
jgi:glycosyltransferase involved in cell wall biosynthesis